MALTKVVSTVDAVGTAMTSGTTTVGADADISDAYEAQLYVYHAVASGTAHTASTQPLARIEISPEATTDDSWVTFCELSFSTTTAATTTLNGAVTANDATIVLTSGTSFVRGSLAFIYETGTPSNSDFIEVASLSTNTITLVDPITHAHATGVSIFLQAERRTVLLPFGAKRVRVVYYGATGPTSCFETRLLKVTGV